MGSKVVWPDKKEFAVCLTHDVDRIRKTYQYITKSKGRNYLRLSTLFELKNSYWGFPEIMKIEDKFEVRSTFFFLQESKRINLFKPRQWVLSAGKYKFSDRKVYEIIRLLNRNGWEIGLHGSYDSYANEDLLREEKRELEQVLGAEVVGVRQHYLNLEIPKTWRIQQNVGFRYDASFGFRDKVGFRDEKYFPFHPFDNLFLEIPLAIMDGVLLLKYDSEDAIWKKCLSLIDSVEKHNGLLTVLWHQRVFNEKEFPGWRKVYVKIIEECRKKSAWFATGRDIYNVVNKMNN